MTWSSVNAPAVEVRGLAKYYGDTKALDGVDLSVREGSVRGVLGPNGAGKTTLIRILSTLVAADAGSATVAGWDVARQPRQLRRAIGLTGQYASVDEFLSGYENLYLIGRLLDLSAKGASSLTLNVKGFQLLDNDAAKAIASGAVTVTRGADGKAELAGALTIDHADISAESARAPPGVIGMDVVEINRPGGPQAAQTTSLAQAPTVGLDIQLSAPGRIFVKGFGLNAEMSLAAHVGGTVAAPLLTGTAHVVRGDYDLAGKRFEIDDRGVVYLASALDQVRLDLNARLDDPTITAIIQIQGTAAKPRVTLTSVPVLPSDEVLSEVLFGRSAAQLSPVEAAQLAAAVTSLATGGGFDVMGGLRNFAKLDRLALGGGDTPGAVNPNGASRYVETGVTVSGGKYIGNRVYLELTGGGRLGPSAQVEVKATRTLSVISQLGGEQGAKLAVRWRVDYGKATVPKAK